MATGTTVLLTTLLATQIAGLVLANPGFDDRYRRETRQRLPQSSVQLQQGMQHQVKQLMEETCSLLTPICIKMYSFCFSM